MEDYEDNDDAFEINYDNVIECKECLNVTRLLAADLKSNPYMTVGYFLKTISDVDLKILNDIVEESSGIEADDEVTNPGLADVVLIAEMLVRAEDLMSENDTDLMKRVNQFMVMITCETLARKGLVKVYHENLSFGEDASKRVIVKKIDGIDYED
jgi:hypothetical protein|tara:strand:- start:718 stop:1182 length:465 start_codon:yes stop_codon:yes gene_type:complete